MIILMMMLPAAQPPPPPPPPPPPIDDDVVDLTSTDSDKNPTLGGYRERILVRVRCVGEAVRTSFPAPAPAALEAVALRFFPAPTQAASRAVVARLWWNENEIILVVLNLCRKLSFVLILVVLVVVF
jgi:hypothetical protein